MKALGLNEVSRMGRLAYFGWMVLVAILYVVAENMADHAITVLAAFVGTGAQIYLYASRDRDITGENVLSWRFRIALSTVAASWLLELASAQGWVTSAGYDGVLLYLTVLGGVVGLVLLFAPGAGQPVIVWRRAA